MDKIVVYCGTRNHYPVMEVAAKSLLYHTCVDRVFFLTEDPVFPSTLPDMISVMDVSGQQWFDPSGPNYHSDWTYMAYLRLAFTKIFPQYDRVLYLDTDTIVLRDISTLLTADLQHNLFAMVREDIENTQLEIIHAFSVSPDGIKQFQSDNLRPEFCIRPYYNSGVMLLNLRELRNTGMDDAMIHELNTVEHKYPDQDVLNLLCNDRILPFPTEYNTIPAISPDFPHERIRIKHFASDKPLWKSSLWQQYRRLDWNTTMQKQNELKRGESL